MAKQRMVNTKFWSDNWIVDLDPTEKLLFLYLLTNERTDICGIYELPLKFIVVETGIDITLIKAALDKFEIYKKVYYIDGWVCILNFEKHQSINDSVKKGIQRSLEYVPLDILAKIRGKGTPPIQGVTGCDDPAGNLTKLNLTKPISPLPPFGGDKKKDECSEGVRDFFQVERSEVDSVVLFWNELYPKSMDGVRNKTINLGKPITMQCKKATEEIIKMTKGFIKKYGENQVKEAIKEYGKDICKRNFGNTYDEHRFSFYEFLSRKNGFRKFITLVPNEPIGN